MVAVKYLNANMKMAYILPLLVLALAGLTLPSPVHAASQTGTVNVTLTYRNGVATPGFVTIEYGCVNPSFPGIVSVLSQNGWVSSNGATFTPACGSSTTAFATWLHVYGQAQTNYGAVYYNGIPSDGSFNVNIVITLGQTLGERLHN
ncbi:MAG TPA: hypothetical protein VJZ32_06410 [Candidatus Bathyarchaeia archaeon]|nr:hypothetical protein [Candidatus Bathyarchaeia archaeon]